MAKRRKQKTKLQVFDLLIKQVKCYMSNATIWLLKKAFTFEKISEHLSCKGRQLTKEYLMPIYLLKIKPLQIHHWYF